MCFDFPDTLWPATLLANVTGQIVATAYNYIRFSTKKQEHGDSERRQKTDSDKWIEANGHTPGRIFIDRGKPSFRGQNKETGELRLFLDAIKTGEIKPGSILVVEKLDRLSRQGINHAQALFGDIIEAGVDIVVLKPWEQRYSKNQEQDLISVLIPIIHFHIAYIESKKKSDDLSADWNNKRKQLQSGEITYFSKRCPSWLTFDDDRNEFVTRPGWEAIPFIFRQSAEGYGQQKILKMLQDEFEPIGTSGSWNLSFIQSVLNDRTVLGELQPKTTDDSRQRIPVGDPIPNYYPRVVEDSLWHRSRSASKSRSKQRGPSEKFINLFTGIVYCAQDQSKMHIASSPQKKNRVRRLVSYKHKQKAPTACPVSVEYEQFETVILHFLKEITPEQLTPVAVDDREIDSKIRERAGLKERLKELEEAISNPEMGNLQTVLKAIKTIEGEIAALNREIDDLQEKAHKQNPVKAAQSVLATLNDADEEETIRLRTRLRMLIPDVIESIWVKPEKYRERVYSIVQINFTDGGHKHLFLSPEGATGVSHLEPGGLHMPDEPMPIQDLRLPESDWWSLVDAIRKEEGQPEKIPKRLPNTLGAAAEIWIKHKKNEVNPANFRVIPSKARRFAKVLGKDLPTKDIDAKQWKKWKRHLRNEVKRERLGKSTARVIWNRSKEVVQWLIDNNLTEDFPNRNDSAARAIP